METKTSENLGPQSVQTHQKMVLPDVASERPDLQLVGALDWVGMSGIEVPVLLRDSTGQIFRTGAKAAAFVSLESQESRGIHMSRLFKEIQSALTAAPLSFALLTQVLNSFLKSHEGLSQKARVEIGFLALIERQALKSDNKGWRNYPIKLSAELNRDSAPRFFVESLIQYSSTCPASAALSRQLIQENFKGQFQLQELDFKGVYDFLGTSQGIIATPHAQRSEARVKVEVLDQNFHFQKVIDLVEDAVQTPVQTMVKREDEQEFALRNGQNLMFCEDAARRIQAVLLSDESIQDFIVEVKHLESLHPHDAVSVVTKGRDLRSF